MREQAEQRRELAEKNRKKGQAFQAENKTKEGVVALESGLQYKVLTAGDGARATAGDTVICHYRGTLLDGTEFDSSYKPQKPGTFPLKRVIRGWREGLQLMPVGERIAPAARLDGQPGQPLCRVAGNLLGLPRSYSFCWCSIM